MWPSSPRTSGRITEELPFVVRLARAQHDFDALCAVRSQAYGRHAYVSQVSENLAAIDDKDRRAFLLVAAEKASQAVIGTMRLSSSLRGPTPMNRHVLAQSQDLGLADRSFLYCDRVAVSTGEMAEQVSLGLFKCMWKIALQERVDWVFGSALKPLARRYRRVAMHLLNPEADGFEMPHLHADKYYAIGGCVERLATNLKEMAQQNCSYFLERYHPDLDVHVPSRVHTSLESVEG
jgi:hypothetical protein